MKLNRRELFRLPLAQVEALSARGHEPVPPPPPAPPPPVAVLGAGPHEITESVVSDWTLLARMRGRWPVLWVHVSGIGHAPTLEGLRVAFGFAGGVADRLLDPRARAAVERFGEHLLLVAPFGADAQGRSLGRAAVLAGPDHLVTFETGAADRFAALRERLRSPYARLRSGGSGAVALAAMEDAAGALSGAAAGYGRRVDEAAEDVLAAPAAAPERLRPLRAELRAVERALQPLPAGLLAVAAAPAPLPPPHAEPRLRALADAADAALESVGAAREAAASLGEAALAASQRRLEARVRTLTVLGVLWLLLTAAVAVFLMT